MTCPFTHPERIAEIAALKLELPILSFEPMKAIIYVII